MIVENSADPEHIFYAHHGTEPRLDRKHGEKNPVSVTNSTQNLIEALIDVSQGAFIPPCRRRQYMHQAHNYTGDDGQVQGIHDDIFASARKGPEHKQIYSAALSETNS